MRLHERSSLQELTSKADWVRKETIRIHGICPETRIASSLSDVEIFVCLCYGGILNLNPSDLQDEKRSRLIISKGHGGVSLYPIFADLGFFPFEELSTITQPGSRFGSIPDCAVPGFETTNGSLGHGLGVAAGMAIGLHAKHNPASVVVVCGDGELYEGSVWEAAMLAGHHALDSMTLIVDRNRRCMLDFTSNVIELDPLDKKFEAFGWLPTVVDGNDIATLLPCLEDVVAQRKKKPKVIIAETIKGKGIPELESDPLCHIRSLSRERVAQLVEGQP